MKGAPHNFGARAESGYHDAFKVNFFSRTDSGDPGLREAWCDERSLRYPVI